MIRNFLFVFCCLVFCGCQTTLSRKERILKVPFENYRDIDASLRSVAEGVSGKALNDKEYKQLKNDLRSDPEAQSAVQSVTDALTQEIIIKYCPVCGKRYSFDFEFCSEDGTLLKILE